jgi:hypothetical protein
MIDDKYLKPFFIFKYNERKEEINKSKVKFKTNHKDFDATNFNRMTLMLSSNKDV